MPRDVHICSETSRTIPRVDYVIIRIATAVGSRHRNIPRINHHFYVHRSRKVQRGSLDKVNEPRLLWYKRAGRSDVVLKDRRTKRACVRRAICERRPRQILRNVDVLTGGRTSVPSLRSVRDRAGKEFEGEREGEASQALGEKRERREHGDHIGRAIWRGTEKHLS